MASIGEEVSQDVNDSYDRMFLYPMRETHCRHNRDTIPCCRVDMDDGGARKSMWSTQGGVEGGCFTKAAEI